MRTLSQAVFPAMPTPPTTPARLSDLSELQRCLLAGALLTMGLSLVALPAGAQTAGSPAPAADAAAAPEATTSVDDILASEEDVLAGTTYSYDPGSRRDPFRSLLAAQNKAERKGALPEGIPGLLIEEIDLTGIFRTSRGFVAQVLASNKEKSYLIREGDQLYDGDVVSITQQEVVFKQIVSDPTVIKPFREVIKKLSP
jgi:Tfp pilus assembly protein PilP